MAGAAESFLLALGRLDRSLVSTSLGPNRVLQIAMMCFMIYLSIYWKNGI